MLCHCRGSPAFCGSRRTRRCEVYQRTYVSQPSRADRRQVLYRVPNRAFRSGDRECKALI